MAFTNTSYYRILGLAEPQHASIAIPTPLIKAKYREALLKAHPDKNHQYHSNTSSANTSQTTTPSISPDLSANNSRSRNSTNTSTTSPPPPTSNPTNPPEQRRKEKRTEHTIDNIKSAFSVLIDPKTRAEYDAWLRLQPRSLNNPSAEGEAGFLTQDFILGLEVLDLGEDFEIGGATSTSSPTSIGNEDAGEAEETQEWHRACRCGDDAGFTITETELEEACSRGEKEVLVGCRGCSLWVRVGFEVDEE